MKVCFLGTGGSWPTKRRNPLSIAVSSGRTHILLDCGEGTQKQMLHSPVSPLKLDAIFVSHLHGDHFLGIPGLVQTMSLNDRTTELRLYGPEGIKESFKMAMGMCVNHPKFETEVTELQPGDMVEEKDLIIKTTVSDHSIPSLAFRISEKERPGKFNRERALELGIPEGRLWGQLQNGSEVKIETDMGQKTFTPDMVLGPRRPGRSMGYTGDTYPVEEHKEFFKGVNMLVHEATFTEEFMEKAVDFKHSTAKGAAQIAKGAGARSLYLIHSSSRFTREGTEEVLLEEARTVFEKAHLPDDLECVEISL